MGCICSSAASPVSNVENNNNNNNKQNPDAEADPHNRNHRSESGGSGSLSSNVAAPSKTKVLFLQNPESEKEKEKTPSNQNIKTHAAAANPNSNIIINPAPLVNDSSKSLNSQNQTITLLPNPQTSTPNQLDNDNISNINNIHNNTNNSSITITDSQTEKFCLKVWYIVSNELSYFIVNQLDHNTTIKNFRSLALAAHRFSESNNHLSSDSVDFTNKHIVFIHQHQIMDETKTLGWYGLNNLSCEEPSQAVYLLKFSKPRQYYR